MALVNIFNSGPAVKVRTGGLRGPKGDDGGTEVNSDGRIITIDPSGTPQKHYTKRVFRSGLAAGMTLEISNAAAAVNGAIVRARMQAGERWDGDGQKFAIDQRTILPSNSGITDTHFWLPSSLWTGPLTGISVNGAGAAQTIVFQAASFVSNRITGLLLKNNIVEWDPLDGRATVGLYMVNTDDVEIDGNVFKNGCVAAMVRMGSLGERTKVTRNRVDTMYSNMSWLPVAVELTGFELDNERYPSATGTGAGESRGALIAWNTAIDVAGGATFVAAHQQQGNGFKFTAAGGSAVYRAHGLRVFGNLAVRSGQGFDVYTDQCIYDGNVAEDCAIYGFSLKHGARGNFVRGTARNSGQAAVALVVSTADGRKCEANVCDITVDTIDPTNVGGSDEAYCCVQLVDDGGSYTVDNNDVTVRNVALGHANRVATDKSAGKNIVRVIGADAPETGLRTYMETFGLMKVRPLLPTDIKVFLPASPGQSTATSAAVIGFTKGTGSRDARGEWNDTTFRFTPDYSGTYEFQICVRAAFSADDSITYTVRKGGSTTVAYCDLDVAVASGRSVASPVMEADLVEGEYIEILNTANAARAMTAGILYTWATIRMKGCG